MRVFVIKARQAPVDSRIFLASVGQDAHVEILAHSLMNALFVAKSHRDDVIIHLVLESSQDFSRIITYTSSMLGDLGGFNEKALLDSIVRALDAGRTLGKDESVEVETGVTVRTSGYELLIKELSLTCEIYLLDRKGTDVREVTFTENSCFLLTDHIPMPRKVAKSLVRQGAEKISLGAKMLFASQCIVLIHNELDR